MKKNYIFFLILFCGLSFSAGAQQAFAPLNAAWNYSYGTDEYTGYSVQKVTGDTVIAGTHCRKVVRTTYKTSIATPSAPVDSSEVERSYIVPGNDTVFYYNDHFARFLPLYIFNVAVGDTLVYRVPLPVATAPNDTLFRVVVDSIVTVNVDGILLKSICNTPLDGWGFSSPKSRYTQLLGSDPGLAPYNMAPHTTNFMTPFVRCYKDNIINYTREPGTVCEGMEGPNNINAVQHNASSIDIYPVPVKSLLYVKVKNGGDAIQSVFITDISGRRVAWYQPAKAVQECQLDLGGKASGLYFIHVLTTDGQLIRKITKH